MTANILDPKGWLRPMISEWTCKHCGEVRHGNKRWACFKLATDGHYGGDCEPLIDATTIRSTPPPPQWNLMELPSFSRDPKITDKVVLTVHNENEATAKIYRHDGVVWTEKLTRYWEPKPKPLTDAERLEKVTLALRGLLQFVEEEGRKEHRFVIMDKRIGDARDALKVES